MGRGSSNPVSFQQGARRSAAGQTRTYWQSAALDWLADRAKWEGLHSVGVVEARRQVGAGPVTVERRYYLSSLAPAAARFARAVRGHWSVENQCH